ncbi:hypothetical protein V6N12_059714 [Hibiscus sabdariffa]|uniref:Uncharacterized protein n=1 Tax=Hibiscus sabdariffa TaxID=183260 RepID=A0ABR2EWG4_9ROSI
MGKLSFIGDGGLDHAMAIRLHTNKILNMNKHISFPSDMVTVEVQGVAGSREVTCPSDARSCSIVVVDEARIQRSQAFKNQWSRFDLNGDVA